MKKIMLILLIIGNLLISTYAAPREISEYTKPTNTKFTLLATVPAKPYSLVLAYVDTFLYNESNDETQLFRNATLVDCQNICGFDLTREGRTGIFNVGFTGWDNDNRSFATIEITCTPFFSTSSHNRATVENNIITITPRCRGCVNTTKIKNGIKYVVNLKRLKEQENTQKGLDSYSKIGNFWISWDGNEKLDTGEYTATGEILLTID